MRAILTAMKKRNAALGFLILLSVLLPQITSAQEAITQADESRLASLYRYLLKFPDDAYTQKRITEERLKIRAKLDAEILSSFRPVDEETLDDASLPTAIDQQRTVVSSLEERLKSRKVDLDLLDAEEAKYYGTVPAPPDADDLRLTKTHEQLLAQKTILEERIAAIDAALALQGQRLTKLTRNQWISQFGDILKIGTYLGVIILIILIERIARGLIAHRIPNPQRRYIVSKIFTSCVYLILVVWAVTTIFSEHPGILTSLAIVGAGLAVALQDVVKDAVGWTIVVQKRLYTIGDRISVGPYTGDVVDMSLLRTTMQEVHTSPNAAVQERTGRTLYMPNSAVLVHDVINFHRTSDFMKSEIHVLLTLESNWQKAEKILMDILSEVTEKYTEAARRQHSVRTRTLFIIHDPTGPQVFMDIATHGIDVTLRFTIPIGMRREVATEITQAMLSRFAAEKDIGLAYKTSMVYNAEHPAPPLWHEKNLNGSLP